MRRSVFLAVGLLFSLLSSAHSAPQTIPLVNPGFEEGAVGQPAPGWSAAPVVLEGGYTVRTVEEKPESGQKCLEIALAGAKKSQQAFGASAQTIDAMLYRGKLVRFSAALRIEGGEADVAQLWMRVDRPNGAIGFFDNMRDRPVTSSSWQRFQITGSVAADAEVIKIGFLLPQGGRAWLDSTAFEVLGDAGAGREAARPLTDRGLDNLVAFAQLYGTMRWFHPSDQASTADWNSIALAGVQRVEKAADAAELARVLEDLFRPLAPTVRVYPTGRRPPLPEALRPSAPQAALRKVGWRHLGVSLSSGRSAYQSVRVDSQGPAGTVAKMAQEIDAAPFRGKKVLLRAAVRADLKAGSQAHLFLRSAAPGGKEAEDTVSITGAAWSEIELITQVAPEAGALLIGATLDHEGKVWVDDVALEVFDQGQRRDSHAVANPSFEEGDAGWPPDGWDLTRSEQVYGYSLTRSEAKPRPPHGGRFSALLASDPDSLVPAQPDEPFETDLGGGVSALVPLALWADASGTLPHADAGIRPPQPDKPEGFEPSGDDRTTRLADVVVAWNVFEHFYPYFDVAALEGTDDWPAMLRTALREAATDTDAGAFNATLARLVAALHDGHGHVASAAQPSLFLPPIGWNWVEDNLVVTWADAEKGGGLHPGDIIQSIDGKPAREVLEAAEAGVSGATPQWRRTRALTELAGGPKDREVKLETQPLDGPAKTVTLQRTAPTYGPGSPYEARQKALPEKIAEVRPGIFYVDLSRIADDDFTAALDRLAAAKGVVFDLRGYPRNVSPIVLQHLTDHTLHSAQWNIPVTTRPHRQGVTWVRSHWTLEPQKPRLQGKVAFLTGGGAISYAESYMGIVEAYHLAEIVGGPTAGTNGNVNPFTLPGGYNLSWTGMKVLKHDGSRHHGVGILPTVPVSPTRRGVAAGKDEVLEKGIEVVSR
jgi:C-terminal processing protease CtpA/Prc